MKGRKVEITPEQRKQIKALAGYGMKDSQIANVLGITESTLQRKCKEDIKKGRDTARASVAKTAYQMAVSGKQPAMTMFYLKTQLGWRETGQNEGGESDKAQPVKVQIVVKDARRDHSE